jgi:hypothetical protein
MKAYMLQTFVHTEQRFNTGTDTSDSNHQVEFQQEHCLRSGRQ